MFRKHINTKKKEQKDRIAWRSHEVTRIEAFSDAVFAFAVTLLIVSLEVPKTFDDLLQNLTGFIPFGFSFLMLFSFWSAQYVFFRRFGLHDSYTYNLNAALIFMVLYFVYPLKFLFALIVQLMWKHQFSGISDVQVSKLMYIYSGGYAIISLLFILMYKHALRKKDDLKLTDSEAFEAKTTLYNHLIAMLFGIASIIVAAISPSLGGVAGIMYAFIWIPMMIVEKRRNKMHRIKFEQFGKISRESV